MQISIEFFFLYASYLFLFAKCVIFGNLLLRQQAAKIDFKFGSNFFFIHTENVLRSLNNICKLSLWVVLIISTNLGNNSIQSQCARLFLCALSCIQHFGQRAAMIIRGADSFTESEIILDGLHPVLKKRVYACLHIIYVMYAKDKQIRRCSSLFAERNEKILVIICSSVINYAKKGNVKKNTHR